MEKKRNIIQGHFLWLAGVLSALLLYPTISIFATGEPPIPSKAVIASDLIGRSLSEGLEDGYFTPDWRWNIESGEISGLKIQSQSVSKDYCSFVVTMILKSQSSPARFFATVQVDYSLANNRWKLLLVKSKGIRIVRTEKYFDCISTKIDDDGWGGVNCLIIRNDIDSPLIVGGVIRTNNSYEWHKFSVIIEGLRVMGVGGTFSWGSVVDYRIHFVELY